jgi:GT2 family glycosyltransferase
MSTLQEDARVAVVVLNWRAAEETLRCLDSLLAMNAPRLEVVVVDNGSGDGSFEMLEAYGRGVTVINSGANLGYAGGNNLGIQHALENGVDWVWVLNNDTTVAPDCLAKLLDASVEADVRVPTIGLGDGSGRLWYAGGHFDTRRFVPVHWGWLRTDRMQPPHSPESVRSSGALR